MEKYVQSLLFEEPIPSVPLMASPDRLLPLVMRMHAIGSWRVDLLARQVWWSREVYEIHGLPPREDPIDLNDAILCYHPADAKTVAWLILNAVEKRAGYSFTLRLKRANGQMRLVHSEADVEVVDDEVVALHGIFLDVTDHYSEKEIIEKRGRLVRSIISNSPAPLIVLDRNLRYLEISPSWVDFYGLPPSRELIGKPHLEIMPNQSEKFRRAIEQGLPAKSSHSNSVYKDATTGVTKQSGAAIFPWRASSDEIGGVIIMLTPPNRPHSQDATLGEIASLVGQIDGNMAYLASSTETMARRRAMKW